MKISTLKRRSQFLRLRGGGRWSGPAFVLEGRPRLPGTAVEGSDAVGPRFGFTVTRKIGNAVVRNKIRRRLKATLQATADRAAPDFDYVVIARVAAFDCPFPDLQRDMIRALQRVSAWRPPPAKGTPQA